MGGYLDCTRRAYEDATRAPRPLSDRAVAILNQAKSLRKEGNFVFPNRRTGRPLSDMAFTGLLERLEIPAVPHGFPV